MSVNKYNASTGKLTNLASGSRTWIGTKAAYEAEQQAGTLPTDAIICITDDDEGLAQEVIEGDPRAVTSNAVAEAIDNININDLFEIKTYMANIIANPKAASSVRIMTESTTNYTFLGVVGYSVTSPTNTSPININGFYPVDNSNDVIVTVYNSLADGIITVSINVKILFMKKQ